MLLQVDLPAGFSISRNGQHHVKTFGCQWDKVTSTEVLKKWRKLTLHKVYDGVEGHICTLCKGPQGDNGEGIIPRSMDWYVDEFGQKVPWKSTDYVNIYSNKFCFFQITVAAKWAVLNLIVNQHFHFLSFPPFPNLWRVLWKTVRLPESKGMHRLCWNEYTFEPALSILAFNGALNSVEAVRCFCNTD